MRPESRLMLPLVYSPASEKWHCPEVSPCVQLCLLLLCLLPSLSWLYPPGSQICSRPGKSA